MSRPSVRIALTVAATLVPMWALAGSVFLNGVNIDGVKGQRFEKATVRIDAEGNVHIDAPGYAARVTTVTPTPAPAAKPPPTAPPPAAGPLDAGVVTAPVPAAATAPVPGRITQRYWLVTEQTTPGMTDFDIDVYVNSRWVRRLRNNEEQVAQDITRELRPGANAVTLIARKAQGSRRSTSASNVFKVIIGEGNEGGGNVMIDTPLIRFQKTAADAQDSTEEFTLTTR
ncbi:hypothetical protein OV208_15995 [Corallococcus sp. bb12-1]|uniref:hypothetical protein n=1 Tax=Corallococcus sp. bb12-1 TaxID=2996784 RepID=UPI00226D518C|nr:hypothetical protein [Corallococcus sp. bb12-1]MCY1042822.1 hypothetical protein [Corallococcus sp. bb12-1]